MHFHELFSESPLDSPMITIFRVTQNQPGRSPSSDRIIIKRVLYAPPLLFAQLDAPVKKNTLEATPGPTTTFLYHRVMGRVLLLLR